MSDIDYTNCRVEKRGYSLDPWRIVTPDGEELYGTVEGAPSTFAPLAYPRKRDAQAALDRLQVENPAVKCEQLSLVDEADRTAHVDVIEFEGQRWLGFVEARKYVGMAGTDSDRRLFTYLCEQNRGPRGYRLRSGKPHYRIVDLDAWIADGRGQS